MLVHEWYVLVDSVTELYSTALDGTGRHRQCIIDGAEAGAGSGELESRG